MRPLLICFIERDCTTRLINQKRSWLKLYYGSMMIAEQDMYYVWHDYIERAEDFRHSPIGKKTYALRSQTIERVFADAKEKHAMRYTPYRGLPAVTAWVKLKFAAMNLKKLAIHKWMRLLFPPFYRIRSRIAGSQSGFFDKLNHPLNGWL